MQLGVSVSPSIMSKFDQLSAHILLLLLIIICAVCLSPQKEIKWYKFFNIFPFSHEQVTPLGNPSAKVLQVLPVKSKEVDSKQVPGENDRNVSRF